MTPSVTSTIRAKGTHMLNFFSFVFGRYNDSVTDAYLPLAQSLEARSVESRIHLR